MLKRAIAPVFAGNVMEPKQRLNFGMDWRRVLTFGAVVLAGCSGRASRVEMADLDPAEAAESAMEHYDTNGDGKLSDDELRAVPGVLKWKSLYDVSGDGAVSTEEIEARLAACREDKLAFRSISANVKLDGRPVPGVTVTLEPEPYLGEAAKSAKGVTNARGYASMKVAQEDLPSAIKARGISVSGVYPGTYKITLSHPHMRLPEVSAEGLPLGDEIARDTVDTSIDIVLSSRAAL